MRRRISAFSRRRPCLSATRSMTGETAQAEVRAQRGRCKFGTRDEMRLRYGETDVRYCGIFGNTMSRRGSNTMHEGQHRSRVLEDLQSSEVGGDSGVVRQKLTSASVAHDVSERATSVQSDADDGVCLCRHCRLLKARVKHETHRRRNISNRSRHHIPKRSRCPRIWATVRPIEKLGELRAKLKAEAPRPIDTVLDEKVTAPVPSSRRYISDGRLSWPEAVFPSSQRI